MAELKELYWEAIWRNDMLEATRLIQIHGLDVNCRNSTGMTILHFVTPLLTRVDMIEHLVTLGADVNARDINQWTPLHHALSDKATQLMTTVTMITFFPFLSDSCRSKLLEWNDNLNPIVKNAVEKARMGMIACLIRLGADVNATFYIKNTSLHRAIEEKNIQAVKILATLGGADLTNQVIPSQTALFLAVRHGEKEVMKLLVDSGADVNALASQVTPLKVALRAGNLKMIETLLQHGADAERMTLFSCTPVSYQLAKYKKNSDLGVLTCLAQNGADLTLPNVMSSSLHEAALLGKADIFNCLLRYRVDIDKVCRETATPILLAILMDELELLEHLVQCGADINATFDINGTIPRTVARTGNIGMAQALVRYCVKPKRLLALSYRSTVLLFYILNRLSEKTFDNMIKPLTTLLRLGADPNITYDQFHVLHEAVVRGDVNMVKALVNLGADVNEIGERGHSLIPFYLVNLFNQSQQAREGVLMEGLACLVEAGTDVNSGSEAITPLFLAVERSDTRMVETLCSLGADINKTKGCVQPIHEACLMDKPDILQYLIEHGADLNIQPVEGTEPLLEAVINSDPEMVECLLKCGANRRIGETYQRVNVISTAIHKGNTDLVKCLIKAGVNVNTKVSYGDVHLNEEAERVKERYRIEIPKRSFMLLCHSLTRPTDYNTLQMLLSLGANRSHEYNFHQIESTEIAPLIRNHARDEYSSTNLHHACYYGHIDAVRMFIIDGSDVNQCDSLGEHPFESLPLASCVDYHTLQETRTTLKVIEAVQHDFTPILANQSMKSLLCSSGLGDVKKLFYPNSARINEVVERFVHTIVEKCRSFTKLISCGSAAEGTKVGLPDEMDFLAEFGRLCKTKLVNIKDAGHDYVHYNDVTDELTSSGSHIFHFHFTQDLKDAAPKYKKMTFQDGNLLTQNVPNIVKHSNRKATSPLEITWESNDKQSRVNISIDIVPSIYVDSWPKGGVQKTWLLGLEELQKHGYYIVPKPPHIKSDLAKEYSPEDLQTLWKISFPHLETYHMQRLEKRVKDVYLLAKILRNPDVCRIMVTDEGSYPLNVDKYITSYMLKMIVFKNVEDFLRSDLSLGEMVCQVYDQVEEGLHKELIGQVGIPLYFMPTVSAVAGHKLNMAKCARVAKIMKEFVHTLYLRACQQDPSEIDDVEEVTVYQRKPTSVYKCIEIETCDMAHLEKCIKDVYLLAKRLRNPDVCRIMVTDKGSNPKTMDKYITSYMLRKVIFQNVDEFRCSDLSLGEMVCQVYDQLEEGLSKEFLILYSMPRGNAVDKHKLNIPKCARVAKIMKKFVHALCLKDGQQDPSGIDDVEVIIYQCKPSSIYRCIEIATPEDMP